jgi:glutaredoxin
MKISKPFIVVVILFSLVIAFSIFTFQSKGLPDYFALCLSQKDVKMYGAFWCPHCESQKEMFGKSWQHISYVECSLADKSGQTKICIDEDIKSYPTWEFNDGQRHEGTLTPLQLSQFSGCKMG